MSDRPTQRRLPRYLIQLPLLHKTKPPLPIRFGVGTIRDVSEGGMCVELSERFQPMTPLRVGLQTDQGAIEVEAQVVWTGERGEEGRGILHGLAFTQIADDQIQAIRNLIGTKRQVRESGFRLPLRISVTCHVRGQIGSPIRGWTGDMSRRGVSLSLPQPLSPGTMLEITLHTPTRPLKAEGVVIWVENKDPRIPGESFWHGIRFTALSWTTTLSLGLYLAEPK